MTLSVVALLAAFTFAGCSQVELEFNAYQSAKKSFPASARENTVAIVVGSEKGEPLLQEEVGGKIANLLREHGYVVAPKEEARYVLSCWFGMDSGKTYSGVMPVYEPGEHYTSRVRTSGGHWRSVSYTLPGYTEYVPYSYTIYCKYLSLTLHDNTPEPDQPGQPDQPAAQPEEPQEESPADTAQQEKIAAESIIWRCSCVNADDSTDLRWRINHMLIASFDYLGADTPRQKTIKIGEESKRVKELVALRSPN